MELMTEVVIDSKLQSNLNSLIENTLEEEKMEKDIFNNNASQPKKRKHKTKKIKSYNKSRIKSWNFLTNIF